MVAATEGGFMEVDSTHSCVDDLFSSDVDKYSRAVTQLKCSLIGSNRQKNAVIEQGAVPRLIVLLTETESTKLKINLAYTLGSIAKGMDYHLKVLIDSGAVPVLLKLLRDEDGHVVEACLCCLKSVFQHPDAPIDILYADPGFVPQLINLIAVSKSCQVSVATIFTSSCKTREHQDILAGHGLVQALNLLLCSPCPGIQLPALQCLAFLIIGNESVAGLVANTVESYNSQRPMLAQIVALMNRNQGVEMQLAAARCLTYLYRCNILGDKNSVILYKALPCVVRMTKKEETVEHRILAAETLAYLIETSAALQRVAAISNHLIPSMSSFLKSPCSPHGNCDGGAHSNNNSSSSADLQTEKSMRRAAFRVFAALAANDEEIRKRIIETDNLMPSLVAALDDGDNPKLQMAAVGCLHSLSRSVQLLRTTFQDHPVWRPLMKMLSAPASPVEPLIVASSTLCNLLLEFSPSKEPILDSGAIEMLCHLTRKYEPSLRLNGVWGLMNMAFQAEQRIKVQIIKTLGSDQIFRLLGDQDINVVMKTLGLLRNLLSNKQHIDDIMSSYGNQIMQYVVMILESDNLPEVKEQALCILANIADGETAKDFIMSNEDMMKKVTTYMMHNNSKLQIAAVVCVQNLIWSEDAGALDRQNKLKEHGVQKILQQLLTTTDTTLYDQVKRALQQFL